MPESTDTSRLRMNRTGMQMSPLHSREMSENIDEMVVDPSGTAIAETRRDYILEADDLGSMPPPATVKGVLKSSAGRLTGNRPHILIDKLAERLAFERGGARLYDAVIAKFRVYGDDLKGVTLMDLQRIRDQEVEHAALIRHSLEKLGADPTAQTPCADLVGVETAGLLQAAGDPRTSLAQTLHAALAAELVDNAGWELLIALAEDSGQADMADEFSGALAQEAEHLVLVKSWYRTLTLPSAPPPS